MRSDLGAEKTIDGNFDTSSHTRCSYDEDIWFRMNFGMIYCFTEVKIFEASYHNYNAWRLDGGKVFVNNTQTNAGSLCDVIQVIEENTIEARTYRYKTLLTFVLLTTVVLGSFLSLDMPSISGTQFTGNALVLSPLRYLKKRVTHGMDEVQMSLLRNQAMSSSTYTPEVHTRKN